jgi:hypothetical protein
MAREIGLEYATQSATLIKKNAAHVHVPCADGEAKFCLVPTIELAKNYRLSDRQISSIRALIEAHADEFRSAWTKHFSG